MDVVVHEEGRRDATATWIGDEAQDESDSRSWKERQDQMAKIMFAELIFLISLPSPIFGSFADGEVWLGLACFAVEIILVLVVRAQVRTYREIRRTGQGEWRW